MLLAFVAVAPGLWNETKNHQCSHQCSCRAQLAQNRGNFVIWLTHSNRFQLLWRLAWLHSPYAIDAVPTGLSRSNEPQVPSIYHQQKVMINQWIWDVQYYPQQVEPLDFCQTCQFITVAWKGSIYPRVHMGTNAMSDPQQLPVRPNCVEDPLGRIYNLFHFFRVKAWADSAFPDMQKKMVCCVPSCFWILWPALFFKKSIS